MGHQPAPTLGESSAYALIAYRALLLGPSHPVLPVPTAGAFVVMEDQQSQRVDRQRQRFDVRASPNHAVIMSGALAVRRDCHRGPITSPYRATNGEAQRQPLPHFVARCPTQTRNAALSCSCGKDDGTCRKPQAAAAQTGAPVLD